MKEETGYLQSYLFLFLIREEIHTKNVFTPCCSSRKSVTMVRILHNLQLNLLRSSLAFRYKANPPILTKSINDLFWFSSAWFWFRTYVWKTHVMILFLKNTCNKSQFIILQWHIVFVIKELVLTCIWCNPKENRLPKLYNLRPVKVFPGWQWMHNSKHLTIKNVKMTAFLVFLTMSIFFTEFNSKSLSHWRF